MTNILLLFYLKHIYYTVNTYIYYTVNTYILTKVIYMYLSTALTQTWGQLLSNVIDYITITLQFSGLHYITITSIIKCNQLNYNYFVNVIDYITDYI